MLHWYRKLYMDETVRKHPGKSRKRVEMCHRSFRQSLCFWKGDYYVIALAQNDQNLFEIIEARQMFFRHYRNTDFYVVGLAGSRDSAVELVRGILESAFGQDGQFRVREYFKKGDFSQRGNGPSRRMLRNGE